MGLPTSGMHWSPFAIRVMLHHYACPTPFESSQAPIYGEVIGILMGAGLLIKGDDCPYAVTPLGKAFVDLLLSTPIPIVSYVDPRFHGGGDVS